MLSPSTTRECILNCNINSDFYSSVSKGENWDILLPHPWSQTCDSLRNASRRKCLCDQGKCLMELTIQKYAVWVFCITLENALFEATGDQPQGTQVQKYWLQPGKIALQITSRTWSILIGLISLVEPGVWDVKKKGETKGIQLNASLQMPVFCITCTTNLVRLLSSPLDGWHALLEMHQKFCKWDFLCYELRQLEWVHFIKKILWEKAQKTPHGLSCPKVGERW